MFFDNSIFIILILISIFLTRSIGRVLKLNPKLSIRLMVWHTIFCVVYFYSTQSTGSDAALYYEYGLAGASDWSPGTRFIEALTATLMIIFGKSQLNIYLVYNLFGVIGLLLLANVLLSIFPPTKERGLLRNIPYLILFSPGLSFWSCAIGKDGIAFLAACLVAFISLDFSRRNILAFVSIVLMFLVRPHIAAVMIVPFGLTIFASKNMSVGARAMTLSIIALIGAVAIPMAIVYSGLEDTSVKSTMDYVGQRQVSNLDGNSSIDLSSMPLPFQMFAYLFRPLFIDAPMNIMWIIVSCDNSLFLYLCIKQFKHLVILFKQDIFPGVGLNASYLLMTLILLSTTTANLGIAIRQKTMFMPSAFVLIAYATRISLSLTGTRLGKRTKS
jgi:hypothetical protein